MPTYPNEFTGPVPLAYRASWTFVLGILGFITALVPFMGPKVVPWLVFDSVVSGAAIAGAVLGWVVARHVALRDWTKLPPSWKVDPITIDDRGVSGAFADPLNPSATNVNLTIPFSRIGNVMQGAEGYWVSGWEPEPWLTESFKAYMGRHPEVLRKGLMWTGDKVRADPEVAGGRKLSEVPLLDRGGHFVLSPDNGVRLEATWSVRRNQSKPLA